MNNKLDRKNFLALSISGILGTFISEHKPYFETKASVGLQLYTIRDQMKKDLTGSLRKAADAGYTFLELAGYEKGKFYGLGPEEFRKIADGNGLQIISSHIDLGSEEYLPDVGKIAEDHVKVGAKYCVQPSIASKARKTSDGYRMAAETFNKAGEIMKERGLKLGYHNHNFEFGILEGKIPYYDIFLADLDKELVTMELDIYWAAKAGQDPVSMFKKYPGRFALLHLKDMYKNQPPFFSTTEATDFAPVGEGMIDFNSIFDSLSTGGVEYMFVEQDNTGRQNPFEAIGTSLRNIVNLL